MPLALTPYVVPPIMASMMSASLSLYAWRHRRAAPGATGFAALMAAAAWWALSNALQVGGDDLWTKLVWHRAQYLGILLVPLAWLAFSLQYTSRESWLTPRRIALASVVPAATLALILTNDAHHLVWSHVGLRQGGLFLILETSRGPWFWVSAGFAYVCLVLGTGLLLPRLLSPPPLQRRQAAVLLLGLAIPWLSNALFLAKAGRLGHDPTPFTLAASGLVCAWGLFRYRLLDLVPVARDAVIDDMTDGMLVLDLAGRVVDLNPAARRILGPESEDPLGRPAVRVLRAWPDLIERFGHMTEGQAEIALGTGEALRHYELRISPLRDRLGRVTGRILVFRDVTAHRRTDAELAGQKRLSEHLLAVARASTERPTLEATLQNTLDVASSLTGAEGASLFLLDESGALSRSFMFQEHIPLVDRNDLMAPVMDRGLAGWVARRRQPALVGDTRGDSRWLPLALPGSRFEIRSALSVPIAVGSSLVGILTLVHPEPGHFHHEHLEFIQAAADQMALAVRNAQIFDARSRIAERQTRLYEVLRAVGGQLDPDAVASVAVEAIGQRTGWRNVAVAVPSEDGRCWRIEASARDLSQVGQQPIERGVVGRAFTTGRTQRVPDVGADPDYVPGSPLIRSELAVPLRRGERRLGVLNLESERTEDFGPEDVLLAESLADAVALALDNARQHRRLLDLERLRDDLTHTLVHDLRNPLTSVSGVLELLECSVRGAVSENQHEMLRVARHSARRMADLIDGILDVSRLESGRMPLEPDRVQLAPLVAETFDLEAPLAEDKRLRLESDVPAAHPAAWADPRLVGRVLQNLVGNAVKFTPEGGRVRVTADVVASDPPMLRVAVSDTGPGIPEQVRAQLFQRFVTSGPGHGSGLGLAFCRLAIEAQGGRIWLEAEAGGGSTFAFTLRLAACAR